MRRSSSELGASHKAPWSRAVQDGVGVTLSLRQEASGLRSLPTVLRPPFSPLAFKTGWRVLRAGLRL